MKRCGGGLALDTNRYTDLCRGHAAVVETVELADEVWLPFICWENCVPDSRWVVRVCVTKLSCAAFG